MRKKIIITTTITCYNIIIILYTYRTREPWCTAYDYQRYDIIIIIMLCIPIICIFFVARGRRQCAPGRRRHMKSSTYNNITFTSRDIGPRALAQLVHATCRHCPASRQRRTRARQSNNNNIHCTHHRALYHFFT